MCGVHRATHFTIAAWLFVFIATFLTSDFQTFAADFSVVTHLFSSTEEEPVGENTTIFREGNVYDLPAFGDQITFFDNENKQFILLDTARKTWTRVSSEYLIQYGTWLKEKASNSDDPLLRFCVAPQFEVRSEKEGTLWYFEHPLLTYRVDATPFDDPEVARQYREFSDWYARLNAMLRPQALPPLSPVNRQPATRAERLDPKECWFADQPLFPYRKRTPGHSERASSAERTFISRSATIGMDRELPT